MKNNIDETNNCLKTITPSFLCTPSRFTAEKQLIKALNSLKLDAGANVLDFGCGEGEYRFLFCEQKYTGLDIVDYDFKLKRTDNVLFVVADANKYLANDTIFDLVLCQFALEYFGNSDMLLKQAYDLLKSEGYLYLCVPTRWVQMYELPIYLLRLFGLKVKFLSGDENEKFFWPGQLTRTLSRAGFTEIRVFSTCGPIGFLLKLFVIYLGGIKYVIYSLVLKLLGAIGRGRLERLIAWLEKNKKVLSPRLVGSARDRAEYLVIKNNIESKIDFKNVLYLLCLESASFLDVHIFPFFKIEFGVLAKK